MTTYKTLVQAVDESETETQRARWAALEDYQAIDAYMTARNRHLDNVAALEAIDATEDTDEYTSGLWN